MSTVCEELVEVKFKWKDIGRMLHIPYHKLKEFKKESNPLVEVINYWLSKNIKVEDDPPPVTWESIVTVLESDSVDERGLAKTITDKYGFPSNQKGTYVYEQRNSNQPSCLCIVMVPPSSPLPIHAPSP